jgi:hypothetical protein
VIHACHCALKDATRRQATIGFASPTQSGFSDLITRFFDRPTGHGGGEPAWRIVLTPGRGGTSIVPWVEAVSDHGRMTASTLGSRMSHRQPHIATKPNLLEGARWTTARDH